MTGRETRKASNAIDAVPIVVPIVGAFGPGSRVRWTLLVLRSVERGRGVTL